MTKLLAIAALAGGMVAAGCGATRSTTTAANPVFPALTSAVATFTSTDHGKDADSSLEIQLLRSNAELSGSINITGTKFDDHRSSGPFALSLAGPFSTDDVDDGRIRIRFNPDGDDDWTFDLHLTMRFSDGTARNFLWRNVRLDNVSPERVLTLDPARVD